MTARALWVVLAVQVATFVILGLFYLARGNIRLGVGQLLLAGVQAIVYSAGIPK